MGLVFKYVMRPDTPRAVVIMAVTGLVLAGIAVTPAAAQPAPQKSEDDCRREFLERVNPPDWDAYEACRRDAVQIRPDQPPAADGESRGRVPDSIDRSLTKRPDHRS